LEISPDLTPFRKFVLILLTYIPRGRYSTYGAMSSYISRNHQKCSARAIGNAMRNNPYAPIVPCHRVLAHDGKIGGFGGEWGEQGKHAAEKKRLLAEEGVAFSSTGKAVGKPFENF
ncbi:DNA binding methylated-DNA--cysteine S-methyltransferase, partial [Saccharata proteae CBS 121410]